MDMVEYIKEGLDAFLSVAIVAKVIKSANNITEI